MQQGLTRSAGTNIGKATVFRLVRGYLAKGRLPWNIAATVITGTCDDAVQALVTLRALGRSQGDAIEIEALIRRSARPINLLQNVESYPAVQPRTIQSILAGNRRIN